MKRSKINYRESKYIKLFDFLCHYKFQDDWVNHNDEQVSDYQIVEIHYNVNGDYSRRERSFQFGIDDAYIERNKRMSYTAVNEREEILSECLPERFRNSYIQHFYVDSNKNILVIYIFEDDL